MEGAQQSQLRLQEAFRKADEEIKHRRFKPLQKQGYLCMAKCCDSDATQEALQQCFAKCNLPVEQAGQLYQAETQRFQARIQRCASACQDTAQDLMQSMGPKAQEDPAAVAKVEAAFATCVSKCADEHVALLKGVVKAVDEQLKAIAR
jgi:hypothetical protein